MPIHDQHPREPLLTLHQLIFLHTVATVEFGGTPGVRDRTLLESALGRPLSGFGETHLFRTTFARAAALLEALIQHHGFVDGNKRTAVLAAAFWLDREGYDMTAGQDEIVELALAVAERRMPFAEIERWFESHAVPRSVAEIMGTRRSDVE